MFSPAQFVVGGANTFSGGATFYPGDKMTVKWQNGSEKILEWVSLYNSPGFTGPLRTGGDFYNFFVLGIPPANWETEWGKYIEPERSNDEPPEEDNDDTILLTSWHQTAEAYPAQTMSYQDQLGLDLTGYITSYYLEDISTAVISIPSFVEYDEGIGTFRQAIKDFIGNATQKSAKKVIIDLQKNSGGQVVLAFDVFRQFFPNISRPESNSRMRIHPLADVLGTTMTSHFQNIDQNADDYKLMVSEEWVVTDRVNVETNRNFTSWEQFRGPEIHKDDTFSLAQKYNLSDPVFVGQALNFKFPDWYYAGTSCDLNTPWVGADITLLTDGSCASACALFVEMMTQSANVRTTVVGGRPRNGPMQAASGSRGAASYNSDKIELDFWTAQEIDGHATDNYVDETGMLISYAGINLRDQLRNNSNGVPTQFLYQPADCRIFWTLGNVNNYTTLWRDVWNSTWQDTSLCVPGSTNATASSAAIRQRRRDDASLIVKYIREGITRPKSTQGHSDNESFGVLDGYRSKPNSVITCPNGHSDCVTHLPGAACKEWKASCAPPGVSSQKVCLYRDQNTGPVSSKCGGYYQFHAGTQSSGNAQSSYHNGKGASQRIAVKVQSGWCMPSKGDGIQSCNSIWG